LAARLLGGDPHNVFSSNLSARRCAVSLLAGRAGEQHIPK
jgi:hypothetical protein